MRTNNNPYRLLIAAGLSLSLFSCANQQQVGPAIQVGSPVDGATTSVINLDQSWTTDTQQAFYFTDQGSRIMPYSWFLALEQSDNTNSFRSNENINAYRYLPALANNWNPDALPVGFAKNIDSKSGEQWVGMTCAACHTGQISYKGTTMRIDGGPTLADFEGFNEGLVRALSTTYKQQDKFDRFAQAVLGTGATANEINSLRGQLLVQTETLEQRNKVNRPHETQARYGYARLDAIGAIFNKILADFNGLPNSGKASDAPVSYPFLWGTHQSDVVQWPGFAPNGPFSIGALIRNGGEVLGVYGELTVPENTKTKHYKSSLNIKNLGILEKWVAELRSPAWPAQYLPPIDPIQAAKGALHYDKLCSSCHQVVSRSDEGQDYKSVLTPQAEVGTDITELENMVTLRPAGLYEGRKEFGIAGPVIGAQTSGLEPLVNSVIGALLEQPIKSIEAAIIEFEGGVIAKQENDGITDEDTAAVKSEKTSSNLPKLLSRFGEKYSASKPSVSKSSTAEPANPLVYKARPLNGIWATAPYLHNGSIANLYDLLLPQEQRPSTFYLGSREYDPVNVGYDSVVSSTLANAFVFDVNKKGNSNAGHLYGTAELSEIERKELLEYLKSL